MGDVGSCAEDVNEHTQEGGVFRSVAGWSGVLFFVVECRVHRRVDVLGDVGDVCCRDDLVDVAGL